MGGRVGGSVGIGSVGIRVGGRVRESVGIRVGGRSEREEW